jgi:putative tryptophan/tyrosine transport system substrate-binding protein
MVKPPFAEVIPTMDRRTLISSTAVFFGLAPLAPAAQAARSPRIGFLSNGSPAAGPGPSSLAALREGLRQLGWVDGQNIAFELRWAEGNPDRLLALAAELVQAKVDVIVVAGPSAIDAAQRATRTIPVVFVVLIDPVNMGFVRSLARPGGNMTGLGSHFEELVTKQLQLLKEAVPKLSRIALLRRPESAPSLLAAAQAAARSLGLAARTLTFSGIADLEKAFESAREERVGAVHVLPSPFIAGAQRTRLIELAARYRLPACYELKGYVLDGGLMSYAPNIDEMFGRAASYVDRILKGASPGDMPIERPARFELVLNLKTAAALGLTIPQSLLQRADEVIR